jgi:putative heme-binding domain-containing protein
MNIVVFIQLFLNCSRRLIRRTRLAPVLAVCLTFQLVAAAENPHWIWDNHHGAAIKPDETRYFRKTFQLSAIPTKALLSVAADDEAQVFINGKQVAEAKGYDHPERDDITRQFQKGTNVIAIRGRNVAGDAAGVLVMLELRLGRGKTEFLVTDTSWRATETAQSGWKEIGFDDGSWSAAVSKGKLGDKPWGDVFKVTKATPAESLTVSPGFKAELIHSSEIGEGSWICMTIDSKGRLIISPQADNQQLLRITLNRSGHVSKIEPIRAPIHQAMGLLYAHNSLYANAHGPNGTGLYRLIDQNHNDQFDTNEVHFLKKFDGEGEHGYHAVELGPDKMIYVINGNHTKLPQGISTNSPHGHYEEDLLLPRQWDAGGHAVGILAPGGHIMRTDPEGKKWELMLAGFRNAYDFDFSPDGEIFTFDSDMEWDWGLPWYRATRVVHAVTGGEYGWRSGTAKWPEYYFDSLPPVYNIGIGSPTGVKFGTKSNFPEKYRTAFFILDWSYGRIFAVHLKPQGASYSSEAEVVLHGKPLNLTDLEFGRDGAMYFITGGRGTQSGLYRLTYAGKAPPPEKIDRQEQKSAEMARQVRHKLESFMGHEDADAVKFLWSYLDSPDRFLSYAARTALEWQELSLWKTRALEEVKPNAALNALLALARVGPKNTQRDLLLALKKFPLDSLSVTQKLDKLRVIELSFTRQGKPDSELAKLAIDKLDHQYPADNFLLNRELSQLLIFLEAPDVVTKTLALLDKAPTQEEQVHYVFHLRNLKTGWTIDQRKHYFEWFRFAQQAAKGEETYQEGSPYLVWTHQNKAAERHPPELLRWFHEAERDYGDGVSYPKYLVNFRKDAIASLSDEERLALSSWIEDYSSIAAFKPSKKREFVQEWKMADLESSLDDVAKGRNFGNGKAAFNDAQCMLCHRFGNEGGSIGPELTAVSSKYSRREILESMLEPSKVISDQFQNIIVVKKDGDSETGRLIDENDKLLVLQPKPLAADRIEIPKSDVTDRHPSKVSPMPEGLLNQFTKEEILDLLAYIESAGKEKAKNFQQVAEAGK